MQGTGCRDLQGKEQSPHSGGRAACPLARELPLVQGLHRPLVQGLDRPLSAPPCPNDAPRTFGAVQTLFE